MQRKHYLTEFTWLEGYGETERHWHYLFPNNRRTCATKLISIILVAASVAAVETISPNLCNRFSFQLFMVIAASLWLSRAATVRPIPIYKVEVRLENTQMKSTLFNMIYFDMQRTGVESEKNYDIERNKLRHFLSETICCVRLFVSRFFFSPRNNKIKNRVM